MEREQFKVLVKAMKAVYAQPTFIPDQDAFNVWFALLGDLPYKQAELAVQKHMATEKFPPTIADIREKAEQITSVKETEMSELEAWAIVRKAIGRSNYYAEEEFEKLPEACKMAVGNPSNLQGKVEEDLQGAVGDASVEGSANVTFSDVTADTSMEDGIGDIEPDFGVIGKDGSLTTNMFPIPIPKGEYYLGRLVSGLKINISGGSHGGHNSGNGSHEHSVTLPKVKAGDTVLVTWVKNTPVVVDVVKKS